MISEVDIADMCEEQVTDEVEDYETRYSFWDIIPQEYAVYMEITHG